MEFTQYKCPVCKKQFESGDDIVVCPECGAPHHRDYYEQKGSCFFEDKHSKDFSFENFNAVNEESSDQINTVCPVCRFNNPPGVMFCTRCGCPMQNDQQNNPNPQNTQNQFNQNKNDQYRYNNQNNQGAQSNGNSGPILPPFGFGAAGVPNFDPLAGMNNEDYIADDIKVGEMAKFVGKNTNYYLTVFNRIKNFGRAKFNFGALFLSGIYFIYRKMYWLGILFALIIIATNVLSICIMRTPEYSAAYDYFTKNSYSNMAGNSIELISRAGILLIPSVLTWLRYGVMLFSGFLANRLYHKHCVKKIKKIKEQNKDNVDEKLTAKGGVNLGLAVSFGVAIIAIIFIGEYIQLTAI